MDINKSIEEYERDFWKEQDFPTELVKKVFTLRKKKLKDLDASDLRIAIGQGVALPYTVPLAFEILKDDLMVDADFYPGDLLKSLLEVDEIFWKGHYSLWQGVNSLIESGLDSITNFEGLNKEIKNELLQRYLQFKKLN